MAAPARRCSQCLTDWPNSSARYGTCPRCESRTVLVADGAPLGDLRAKALKGKYADFRRWLAEHPDHEFPPVDLSRFDAIPPDVVRELESIPTIGEAA